MTSISDPHIAQGPQVVILAAGLGTRLGALNQGRPKALFELAGTVLLARAIEFARTLQPKQIVIVGGYRYDLVEGFVRELAHRLSAADGAPAILLVENRSYQFGNLYSVQAALPHLDGAFYLTNVDHVFPSHAGARIMSEVGSDITGFCQFDRQPESDEMKVQLGTDGGIDAIAKTLQHYQGAYIGLTYVPAAKRRQYAAAATRARERYGDAAVAENVLQALADDDQRVAAASLDGLVWCEVDTPADIERGEAMARDSII